MAAGAHPRVDCPAGSMSFGRWSPASTDVESSSARLAGLASLCQKLASLFPRPDGPPPCEGHARRARSGRQGAQEFADLAMRTALTQSWPRLKVAVRTSRLFTIGLPKPLRCLDRSILDVIRALGSEMRPSMPRTACTSSKSAVSAIFGASILMPHAPVERAQGLRRCGGGMYRRFPSR